MNDTAQNIADDSQFIWGHLEPVDSIKHKVYRIDFLTTDVKVTIGRSEQLCDIILASRSISKSDGLATCVDWSSLFRR